MTDEQSWEMRIEISQPALKLDAKRHELEKEVNSITIALLDETDEKEVRKLKLRRNALEKEIRYIARARKAQPVLLHTSFDVLEELEKAREKEIAEGFIHNN